MRILVTGGAGFIGSHIADAFLARGDEVLIVDDLSTGQRENLPTEARFEEIDIRDGEAVQRIFRSFRPQVVSHQAAQTSVSVSVREPQRDAEINLMGGLEVLLASVDVGVHRFIFASTGGAIYGEVLEGTRAAPGAPLLPISPYACSKLGFENYLKAYHLTAGLPITILRYANVYGPRQDPYGEAGVVAIFSDRLLDGLPVQINAMRERGDAGCVRDYVYVGDVVEANLRAADGLIEENIINVATGIPTTTETLARSIASSIGRDPELIYGPRREGDLQRSVLEPDLRAFGRAPVDLDEGIRRTTEWFDRMKGG